MNFLNPVVRPIEILLVEDNDADVELTREAFREAKIHNILHVANDGAEALDYLYRRGKFTDASLPDMILLDLNLPRKDGREVLQVIKADDSLKMIPVVILTSSSAEKDVVRTYSLNANCYVVKPVDFDQFMEVIRSIEDFWLTVVKFPPHEKD